MRTNKNVCNNGYFQIEKLVQVTVFFHFIISLANWQEILSKFIKKISIFVKTKVKILLFVIIWAHMVDCLVRQDALIALFDRILA